MNKYLLNSISTGVLILLLLFSCKLKLTYYQGAKVISKACELHNKINDTVVVRGFYSRCMEYDSFNLMEKDGCYDDFDLELNFNKLDFSTKFDKRFDKMQGCGVSMKMVLKGVLEKDSLARYGHLGTNNAQLHLLEIVNFGRVEYVKLKSK